MESLSTFVQSPLFSHLSVALGGPAMVIFFWWRAGSNHALLDRFWRLVAGRADAHDPVLQSMLNESRDIEKFQYFYRLKVETMAAVHRLDAWRRTHKIGMSRLRKIRRWIDVESAEIVLQPPKYYAQIHFGIAFCALLAIVGLSQIPTSPDAYLQMRASKAWFKTDGTSVKAFSEGWAFDQSSCTSDRARLVQTTGFNAAEAEVICKALREDGLKDLVKKTVKLQVGAGIALVLIAAIITFSNFLAAGSAIEAMRLRKRCSLTNADNVVPQIMNEPLAAHQTSRERAGDLPATTQDEVGSLRQP